MARTAVIVYSSINPYHEIHKNAFVTINGPIANPMNPLYNSFLMVKAPVDPMPIFKP